MTDDQPGVTPVFDPTSDWGGDGILSPGESWTFTASGTVEDLTATSATTVPGCDPENTGLRRPAYENLGTVTVPGDSDSDPSHYCNPD